MKLNELLDVKLLNSHLANRFVGVQTHPTLPLRIFNYTHLAPHWGDGTIDYCRGLIVDNEDNIIARPFKKFHNLNTASIPETLEENLPSYQPLILQKYDGSLGIYWQYGEHFGIATRGSFTSPQAQWATKWFLEHRDGRPFEAPYHTLEELTPLFEIIYNENRIVVKYRFEGLVLLGLTHKETGMEICYQGVMEIGAHNNIRVANSLTGTSLAALKEANDPNEEGFVVSYPRFNQDDLKVKIKMADYVRLHRIITGLNAHSLWEIFKVQGSLDFLKDTPPHVKKWAGSWYEKLWREHSEIWTDAVNLFINRPFDDGSLEGRKYRAECATYFLAQGKAHLKSLFFAQLDGKDIKPLIWDMIEPSGADKSFQASQG